VILREGAIELRPVPGGRVLRFGNGHADEIVASPDGRAVAEMSMQVGGERSGSGVVLWRAPWRKPVETLPETFAAFTPDARLLLTWGGDCFPARGVGSVVVRSARTGRPPGQLADPASCARTVLVSPNGELAVVGLESGAETVWRLRDGRARDHVGPGRRTVQARRLQS
jgi:hypothetical protein